MRIVDPNGAALSHADCRAANDRGVWPFVAPGAVTVPRSNVPLDITCGIESRSGFVRAIPQVKTWSPTDTLAVGGIHQALDPLRYPATGYPQEVEVVIGQALSVQPSASGAARTGR